MKKILIAIICVAFISAIRIGLADDGWFKSIMDAADVDKTPPADGQALLWDDTDNLWRAGSVATGSGDITDVYNCATGDCNNIVMASGDILNGTSGTIRLPNSATLPATCTIGDSYMDTDATSGQRFYLCESTDTWALQGDGGAGGGDPVLIDSVAVSDASGVDLQGGAGVDITFNAAVSPDTASFIADLTELNTATFGSGTFTTLTFDAGVTDPILTFGSNSLAITNAATFTNAGNAISDAATAFGGDIGGTIGATAIQANSVALTTDTTGNYAAGDAEAGAALTGDSATSFFASGTIEDARLPTSMADKTITGSLTIPQGASPTVDAAGEIAQDTTDDQLLYGATPRVLAYTYERCLGLETPVVGDDNVPIWSPNDNITISSMYCRTQGGTSAELQVSDGTNACESIVCDSDGQADDGTLVNNTFAANERMEFDTIAVTGSVTWVNYCVRYSVDRS